MVVAQASNFLPGQIVKCVATDAVGLTKGKHYRVIAVRDGWILVVTDFGVESSYAEGRFRLEERDLAANTVRTVGMDDMAEFTRAREQIMLRELNRCRGDRQVILVVEGSPTIRSMVSEQLRGLNYIVLEADDACQAQDLLRSDPTIALLFTDVTLPNGMSGFDLCRLCEANWPEVKILLTAGAPLSRHAADTAMAMEWPLIGKPYGVLELASHVMDLLNRRHEPLFLGPYLVPRSEPLFLGPYLRHG